MTWTKVSGEGIWQDYVNEQTGEHTLKTHTPRHAATWCAFSEHVFAPDIPPNRRITCTKCGQEIVFVVGYHELKNGHLSIRDKKD